MNDALAIFAYVLGGVALYLYAFWLLYILIVGVYRAHITKRLSRVVSVLLVPVVILGFLIDLASNWTVAAAWFREWPPKPFDLVTDRLQRYMADTYPTGRNKSHARAICAHLLDPFDPSSNGHCR